MRSPLQDLNTSICASSSSVSIEAPKGCLRFFSKSPNLKKSTFKTVPNAKSIYRSGKIPKEHIAKTCFRLGEKPNKSMVSKIACKRIPTKCSTKALSENQKNFTPPAADDKSCELPELLKEPDSDVDLVEKLESGSVFKCELYNTVTGVTTKKPNSKTASIKSSKRNPKHKQRVDDELDIDLVEKSTPFNKLDKTATGVGTSSATTTTTPPVQASVSPEINCVSSSSVLAVSAAKTPACYGAGHIVSGVADRRKCRARGILTVGQKDSSCTNLNIVENGDNLEVVRKSRMSSVPFPAEASMHWLLSPCEEIEEDQRTTHSSVRKSSLDLCNILDSSSSGSARSGRGSKITLLSPCRSPALKGISGASPGKVGDRPSSASPTCRGVVLKEVRKNRYDLTMESSPFTSGSLGSGNVILTPQLESSSDRKVGMSWLSTSEKKIYEFGCNIDSATEDLSRASLSPKINRSIRDPSGFNFHLPDFISLSNSVDLSQLPNSMSNEMSASHMKVLWRDGLSRRIFEMDESDFCRCLSDDESDANKSSNGKVKSSLTRELNDDMAGPENCEKEIASLEFIGHEPKYDGKREEFGVKRSNPCEESICMDGGGLAASGDSDWTSCYKNQLFEV